MFAEHRAALGSERRQSMMVRAALRFALRLAGMDDPRRFGPEWSSGALLGTLIRVGVCFLRGTIRRIAFGRSAGLVLVGRGVTVLHPRKLHAGPSLVLEDHCEVNANARRGIKLGRKVTIGSYALIRPTNAYGGEVGEGLEVGDNSNIGPYCYVGCSGFVKIGNNVMMSPRVSLYAENHNYSNTDIPMKEQGVTREFLTIEDDCWIASHSVIVAGVTVGRGSVVAAGSVVTKDVPPYSIVGGVPARILASRLTQQETGTA
jgi:acetyltransferase-like isoleucine patch superfamily enzyme